MFAKKKVKFVSAFFFENKPFSVFIFDPGAGAAAYPRFCDGHGGVKRENFVGGEFECIKWPSEARQKLSHFLFFCSGFDRKLNQKQTLMAERGQTEAVDFLF